MPQALALLRERKNAMGRGMLVRVLVGFGDACRAAGDLPTAVGAWQQALQILHDLGWPENPRIRARLEQADPRARRVERQLPPRHPLGCAAG